MAGQGLGPLVNKKPDIVIAPPSRSTLRLAMRDSPTYDPYRSGQGQNCSMSLAVSTLWGVSARKPHCTLCSQFSSPE